MIEAIFLDLDNTLYRESTFVKSGFWAVAQFLSSILKEPQTVLFNAMLDILKLEGRGQVFNQVLSRYHGEDSSLLQTVIYIYRTHRPEIYLDPEAKLFLNEAFSKKITLALVTDGMASVQRRKIEALNIAHYFQCIVCTDELGKAYWKPSQVPFQIALQCIKINPENAVYVGDDVSKDFIGPTQLKMKSFWLQSDIEFPFHQGLPSGFNPEWTTPIQSLSEIRHLIS